MSLSKSSVAISHNILQTARLAARHTRLARVQLSHLRHQTRQYSEALASTSSESTDPSERNTNREGWLFVDSVFPVKLGTWDVRYYLGYFREETLLERLHALLKDVNNHGFRIIELEPQLKDGGVFIKFGYDSGNADVALEEILSDVRNTVAQRGGVPSWAGMSLGDVWLVKGNPWREDLMRYPSPIVKITFEGPDVDEETLYSLLRPYGRMGDIVPPSPVPAGTLRSSTVLFRNIRGAVRARNTLHGLMISSPNSTTKTRLKTSYQAPVQAHAIRNYITSHPRIFLPVLFFILGTFTYTIFDPIRVFMVEGKMQDWFDIRQFKLYQWLRTNTVDRFTDDHAADDGEKKPSQQQTWKERMDAQDALQRYLSDMPNTIVFLHGPQGSGKSSMLGNILRENGRKTLIIDVGALSKATSESALVTGLASQTGYWPVFSFLNSMNNLIDLASVGVIGQKTGLSSSISDQLKQILEVVGTGLKRVNTSYKQQQEDKRKKEELDQVRREQEAHISRRIKEGTWHDGRLDCLAGNGVMSELGIGDEWFSAQDADAPSSVPVDEKRDRSEYLTSAEEAKRRQQNTADLQAIESMPVVIIKNFESKGGGTRREELLDVLSQWAATLAENQVAHVIVISANRENAKRIAKALPAKPLNNIALSDADSASSLTFVKQKLHDVGIDLNFHSEQVSYIQRLGGRASDLESLIHKVRSGQSVEEAVEDIISRGTSELRKNAFGDDLEDAKSLSWTREQAWMIMKQLANKTEISYHDLLLDFPFKGDETALRNMEHAELISIATHNGRPSTIKPGKPVYRYVFERLVHDTVFQATQDIAFNMKLLASAESVVKTCEDELVALNNIDAGTSTWWGPNRAVKQRREHVLKNLHAAGVKIENLEKQNIALKKLLSKSS